MYLKHLPQCGNKNTFTEARNFNLMFKTFIGPVDDVQIVITNSASGSAQVDNLVIDQDYWVEEVGGPGFPTSNITPGAGNRLGPVTALNPTGPLNSATFVNDPV